jgi:hypothetical protein
MLHAEGSLPKSKSTQHQLKRNKGQSDTLEIRPVVCVTHRHNDFAPRLGPGTSFPPPRPHPSRPKNFLLSNIHTLVAEHRNENVRGNDPEQDVLSFFPTRHTSRAIGDRPQYLIFFYDQSPEPCQLQSCVPAFLGLHNASTVQYIQEETRVSGWDR